jgi:ribonucleoside-diphosphate reductase alpha chain
MVVVDGNTMGSGIIDECLKESFDPNTGKSLGCWNTINTEQEPELEDAEEILFDLHSQGINSDIIITFIDVIESRKLQLLEKKQDNNYEINDKDYYKNVMLPHIQTDLFLEEISNLKLKQLGSGKFTVEQVTKRINKDRYSAVAYGCYFIKMYEDNIEKDRNINLSQYVFYN